MIKITVKKDMRIIPKTEEDFDILRCMASMALEYLMSKQLPDNALQNAWMSKPVEWVKVKRACEEIRSFRK